MPSSLFGPRTTIPTTSSPQIGNKFQPPANLGQIKGLMSMMQNGGNLQSMLQSLMASNPQIGQVMNLVQQYNGDAKSAFYDLAKQKGVDPNEIINMLK